MNGTECPFDEEEDMMTIREEASIVRTQDSCAIQKSAPSALPSEGPNLEDCAPPSGRGLNATLNMDACGTQPAGGRPPLAPAIPNPHYARSCEFRNHPDPACYVAKRCVPPYAWRFGKELHKNPLGVIEKRSSALQYFPSMADQLDSANTKWRGKPPLEAPHPSSTSH